MTSQSFSKAKLVICLQEQELTSVFLDTAYNINNMESRGRSPVSSKRLVIRFPICHIKQDNNRMNLTLNYNTFILILHSSVCNSRIFIENDVQT